MMNPGGIAAGLVGIPPAMLAITSMTTMIGVAISAPSKVARTTTIARLNPVTIDDPTGSLDPNAIRTSDAPPINWMNNKP